MELVGCRLLLKVLHRGKYEQDFIFQISFIVHVKFSGTICDNEYSKWVKNTALHCIFRPEESLNYFDKFMPLFTQNKISKIC